MRNMSFALTKAAMLRQQKDVTRRLGWLFLKVGDLLQPIEKGMGLKPGETIVKIGGPIEVIGVSREPLQRLLADVDYGFEEVVREGFDDGEPPSEFVAMFCRTHKGCKPDSVVTRIEFRYCPVPAEADAGVLEGTNRTTSGAIGQP